MLMYVLRCECDIGRREDQSAVNFDQGQDRYERTLVAWDAVVDIERNA